MEAALAVHEKWQLAGRDLVRAVACGVGEGELPDDRGESVMGRAHGVDQAVARGVLVVVEVALRALALGPWIQRIDEHAGDGAWPRDLDAGTLEVVRHGRHLPVPRGGGRRRRRARQRPLLEGAPEHGVSL